MIALREPDTRTDTRKGLLRTFQSAQSTKKAPARTQRPWQGEQKQDRQQDPHAQATALAELQRALEASTDDADGLTWLTAWATHYPLLSADDERRLAARMRSDDAAVARAARDQFTLANLRIVMRMARSMFAIAGDLQLTDVISEGVLGLLRAIDGYDPASGYRFTTYATWWIAQAIHRGVAQHGHAVRLPQYLYERRRWLVRERARLLEDLQREPTLDELVAAACEAGRGTGDNNAKPLDRETIALLLTVQAPMASLSRPLRREYGGREMGTEETLAALLMDPASETDVALAEQREDARWLLEVARSALRVGNGSPQEQRFNLRAYEIFVIRALEPKVSLETIGARYGITRERVRQIEEVANKTVRLALVERGVTPSRPLTSYPTPYAERRRLQKRESKRRVRAASRTAEAV